MYWFVIYCNLSLMNYKFVHMNCQVPTVIIYFIFYLCIENKLLLIMILIAISSFTMCIH